MLFTTILHHYVWWHYTTALKEIWHVWKNLIWFTANFFSLRPLITSLFSPWKRITFERGDSLAFEDLTGYVIINLISRILGATLRSTIILMGLLSVAVLLLLLVATYIIWLVAPAVLVGSLIAGITLLLS
jgi:hypothetical protein